jgi:3-methyladenine DNA glycosylase/8-oxoguanine DNA glycosylase
MTPELRAAAIRLLAGRAPMQAIAQEAGMSGAAALGQALSAACNVQPHALREWARSGRYRMDYNGPFHLEQTLAYLGRDPENLAEQVQGSAYTRWFPVHGRSVPVTLTLGESACTVTAPRPARPEDALALHLMIRRCLGLDQPLAAFYRRARAHRVFAPLVVALRGVRIPQLPSLWEALCWAVVGQQINLAFAYRLRNRLIALGNGLDPATAARVESPLPFPSPGQVARLTPEALRQAQFSRQKADYVLSLARAFADGALDEAALCAMAPEEAERALLAQRGLGPWSAAYALMRGLGHPDALPVGDTGLRTALQRQFRLRSPPDPKRQAQLMEPLRPYRSLATYYLWKSLNTPAAG